MEIHFIHQTKAFCDVCDLEDPNAKEEDLGGPGAQSP